MFVHDGRSGTVNIQRNPLSSGGSSGVTVLLMCCVLSSAGDGTAATGYTGAGMDRPVHTVLRFNTTQSYHGGGGEAYLGDVMFTLIGLYNSL